MDEIISLNEISKICSLCIFSLLLYYHIHHHADAVHALNTCVSNHRSFKRSMESHCTLELKRKRYGDVVIKVHPLNSS